MKTVLQFVGYFVVLPILSPVIMVALVMWISKWLTDETDCVPTLVSNQA